MQVNDKVICAYAHDTDKLTTHKMYVVAEVVYSGTHIIVQDADTGVVINGTYLKQRFMLESDVIKQVLENARNDR